MTKTVAAMAITALALAGPAACHHSYGRSSLSTNSTARGGGPRSVAAGQFPGPMESSPMTASNPGSGGSSMGAGATGGAASPKTP